MNSKIKIISLREKPENQDIYQSLIDRNWDKIGTLDDVGFKHWFDMLNTHPEFQFGVYLNDELAGVGNCVPLWEDILPENLPDEGWRWAIKSSLNKQNKPPLFISAISATIDKNFRGQRVSSKILAEFKSLAKSHRAKALIAPVRPSLKHKYPLIDMNDYIQWRKDDGQHFDSWLRIHESVGGKILKVSRNAMIATREVSFWEELSGECYKSTGQYLIAGGLCPINIDLDKNLGVYKEDGVWVIHALDQIP